MWFVLGLDLPVSSLLDNLGLMYPHETANSFSVVFIDIDSCRLLHTLRATLLEDNDVC